MTALTVLYVLIAAWCALVLFIFVMVSIYLITKHRKDCFVKINKKEESEKGSALPSNGDRRRGDSFSNL